jgi:hypothetical protein
MHLNELKGVIKDIIKKEGISVTRKKFKSPAGRAWVSEKRIKIPKIIDFQSAGTAIHEIGHIILGHLDDVPDYICEYETEKWTINFLKSYNMHIDYKAEFECYVEGAKLNVSDNVKRYISRAERTGESPKIRKKILKWLNEGSI